MTPPPPAATATADSPVAAASPLTGWRLWLAATRPYSLTISLAPVLAGSALAWTLQGTFSLLTFVATLCGALLVHIAANLWNDVVDDERGGDRIERQGPPRLIAMGWVSAAAMRRAAYGCFAAAAVFGLVLVGLGGWPIAVLGVASLLAGWAYSGGYKPIATTAWGEVWVTAFFGVGAVGGTVWLQIHSLDWSVLWLGIAVGLPSSGVLMVNNIRDVVSDTLSGRQTLAIRVGRKAAIGWYAAMMLAPFPLLLLPTVPLGAWGGLVVLPLAVWTVLALRRCQSGPEFTRVLELTAKTHLALAVAISAGLVAVSLF